MSEETFQSDPNTSNTKIEAVEGIVGFFDVLGFQNYLTNNPNIGSKHALEVILKIKTEVPKKLHKRASDEVLKEVSWNVLSDTIVLCIPYPREELGATLPVTKNAKLMRWFALFFSSIALMDHMFDKGLPIRGAISYGKYFVHANSLAGKSIIDALSLTQKLDISAVAVCSEAEKELRGLSIPMAFTSEDVQNFVFPYLVPLKNEMQKLLVLDQWALDELHDNSDIPQLVAQSFWKHGKDMDEGAYKKFRNTEMLLRYCVARKRRELYKDLK